METASYFQSSPNAAICFIIRCGVIRLPESNFTFRALPQIFNLICEPPTSTTRIFMHHGPFLATVLDSRSSFEHAPGCRLHTVAGPPSFQPSRIQGPCRLLPREYKAQQ